VVDGPQGTLSRMPARYLEILLPADLTNPEYAALTRAVWSVVDVAGLAEDSMLRTDKQITDEELNKACHQDGRTYPWSPS
jgi:hypothetical protein